MVIKCLKVVRKTAAEVYKWTFKSFMLWKAYKF
jgi:hypothetical protein